MQSPDKLEDNSKSREAVGFSIVAGDSVAIGLVKCQRAHSM